MVESGGQCRSCCLVSGQATVFLSKSRIEEIRLYIRQAHGITEECIRVERQVLLLAAHDSGQEVFSSVLPFGAAVQNSYQITGMIKRFAEILTHATSKMAQAWRVATETAMM